MKNQTCRCGYRNEENENEHPCHGKGYTCKAKGTKRYIATPMTSLAGVQMKVGAYETFACDECWAQYRQILKNV